MLLLLFCELSRCVLSCCTDALGPLHPCHVTRRSTASVNVYLTLYYSDNDNKSVKLAPCMCSEHESLLVKLIWCVN